MTRLLAGRFVVRTPARTSNCFPLPFARKGSGTHRASFSIGTGTRSPRVKQPGREVHALILLLYAFVARTETTLLLALSSFVSQDSLKNSDCFPVQHLLLALSNGHGLCLFFVGYELNLKYTFNT